MQLCYVLDKFQKNILLDKNKLFGIKEFNIKNIFILKKGKIIMKN